jgi:hypothetical protein
MFFSREQLRDSDRPRLIRANAQRFLLGASVHILPCFHLTIFFVFMGTKSLAATNENNEAALSRANATGEVRPTTPPENGATLASADVGSTTEDTRDALALTPRYAPPAFSDPPSGFLQSDDKTIHPLRPSRCILFNEGLCRAIHDKREIGLAAIKTAALVADGVTTRQYLSRGYVEVDPLTKIFLGSKPTWGRMAPLGAVQVIAGMWIAERMATSRHRWIRRFWWLPQVVGIAGNTLATANNVSLR